MSPRSLIIVLAGALASLALTGAPQAQAQSPESRHVRAELIADSASIQPGGTIHVALRQTIAPGWHTYWRNPGDSGQATSVTWTLPEGWKTGELTWPTPRQLRTGPLMDYGYEGVAILPQTLTAPSDAKAGQSVTLRAAAAFLVCKDVCVPEDAALTLTLPVSAAAPDPDAKGGAAIAATLTAAPGPGPLTAVMTTAGAVLKLSVTGAPVKGGDFPGAYFYPYDASVIDHPQPQTIERGPGGLTLTLAPGSAFKTSPAPTHLQGVLDLGGKAYEIDAKPGPVQPSAAGLGAVSAAAPSGGGEAGGGPKGGLAVAIAFAFLGGLILNLMPCVFPVLSMKAVSLASHAHTPQAARLQGLAFLVGVVITFVGLAGLLIAVRAAGQAVGWGFQLQSPIVIAGLTLVMLGVALNLAGLFEIGAGVQSAAGGVQVESHGETLGAFLTGVLAVAVAAPCTAPFMAPAIGFAFTQPPAIALSVFLALGLGMAAPFTLAAFAPPLLALLPRPGGWMGVFKQVMAFPMFATAAWLLWVFSQQVGPIGLAGLLTGAVLVALAAWIYGRAQSAQIAGRGGAVGFLATAVLVLAAGVTALTPTLNPDRVGAAPAAAEGEGLTAEAFSPERLAELRAAGKPVFVNFTAAWCVTCQVNDKVALSSRKVAEAFKRGGIVYLKGDWTNRDAVIAKVLSDHGRAGVPLYLFYGAGGRDAAVLPQILTEGIVLDAADKAARP
ncbi:MAG: protein-disulfide reductase DsbD family protein [Caulobacteraceae bacterium]|nr:protein-disulfide reductase DsbD family protein [Caulobacteraceae bacterium]